MLHQARNLKAPSSICWNSWSWTARWRPEKSWPRGWTLKTGVRRPIFKRQICAAAQDLPRCAVRDHASDTGGCRRLIQASSLRSDDFLFPSRIHDSSHLGTRQYARIVEHWVADLDLARADYGTHSMRRTKATLICRRTRTCAPCNRCLGIETRVNREIPGHRSRRRPADRRADADL